MTQSADPRIPSQPPLRIVARVLFSLLLIMAVLAVLLFIPAGRLDWPEAWVLLVTYSVFLLLYGIWGLIRDPAQLQERRKPGANAKAWDRFLMLLYSVLLVILFPVCALDAGRFRWSSPPRAVEALGWIGLALAGAIIFWVMTTNTFASRMARIQQDRGQTVVSTGPYRYVRHPMYLGNIILFAGIPVALGSLWGLIPGLLIALVFILRTALEDRMLRRELTGYEEYAAHTRYRLFPGIW
jgi:protein-S-isoprenylcysteine O-methyltransferase Ste14